MNSRDERTGAPRWVRAILGIPLLWKLAGANVIIVLAALYVVRATGSATPDANRAVLVLGGALALALIINLVLVAIALRPLRQIEATVEHVWRGELSARVPESLLADRNVDRVGRTINLLLDSLTDDREKMRRLARQVISASEAERAQIARSLHDSAAQALAALSFQASAAAHDSNDPAMTERLTAIRELALGVMDEVRVIGQAVYSSVLDDLGLVPALRKLARETHVRDPDVNVNVNVDPRAERETIPADVASVLYHAAREGVTNALRHGKPQEIAVEVVLDRESAQLVVSDDGRGFDVATAVNESVGTGLFGIRERLALVRGRLDISSNANTGTRMVVSVPLEQVKAI